MPSEHEHAYKRAHGYQNKDLKNNPPAAIFIMIAV